ncbi:MAG: PAS domain S-box protein, partial [Limisphaerales bacterium]
IYDADRRFRFLNARGLLEARKSIEEVLGRRDEEVFPPEMVNAYLPVLNRAIETRKPQTEVVEIALPSGHVHLAYSFTPLLKADGSVREVLAVTNDMTVVVRNDRRVHQLNRTLAAISAANSVLVRATTEAALLQGFCDALVGATGHRLAWVGLVTPPDPAVRVAAYAGQGGGYLDGIEVRWDDTLKGRGPTGTCIRLGQPVICRDFLTEEQMAPWRERATECGMRSSVALPLLGMGGVLGAFTLYSSEQNRFDDQEVRLLVELADDLAYGLAAVRREAALAAAEATLAHERGLRESIMTHSTALVYVVDLEGRFLYTNPALDRVIGQPEGCSAGKLRSDVIPAETAAAHHANDLEVARSGRPIQFEEGNLERGAAQSYLTVKFPLFDATGKVFAVGGVSTNVTQLKQSEQALFESEERLRLALSAASQGIWDLDLPTGRAVVSPDYATMLGYAPEELHESHAAFTERLHPDDLARVEQAHRDYLDGKAPHYQVECRQRTKSGEWKWILSVGRVIGRDAEGRPLRMMGTHTDITARKETETRLRESQERLARDRALLRALLDSIPDLIFFKDSNSVYLGCNRAFEAYSGMREEELVGKSDRDIVPRDAAERYQMKDREVLTTGQPHRNEEWVPFKNGGGGEFETLKTPYYGPGGETLGLIGISRDIGERRQAEQALRESEVRFRAMFEEAPLGIALIDSITGHFQEVNRRFAEIAGRPRTDLQTVDWMSITHPEDVHGDSEQMALMNAGKISGFQMEKRYLQPDGRVVWVSMTIALLKSGDAAHPRHLCMIEDITERRRDAERLRLQGSALDAAANGIVITDAQGVIRWVNDAFTKLTGYSRAEVVGQNPRVLKSGEHPPGFYQALWQTILAGNVWHGELHNRRKDGTLYFEEMTIAPVRDTDGHVTHFIAIKQDITEKKNLEKRFLRAQRLEGIGLLAGGIAHDLNNVLAPILMGADMLKLAAADERSAHQLGIIAQSARRGAEIVKQVLTFARGIEGERVQLQPKHIVKEMAHMARETFPRNLQVHVDVPDDLWPVVGDPTQLHQVLLNLSVNARDAMPDGGDLGYS